MNLIIKNKGVILFYIGIVLFCYLYMWRIEKLEEVKEKDDERFIIYVN
ncbi:MAG: hypothetical protein ACOXZR_04010 [Bacilli bacterium]